MLDENSSFQTKTQMENKTLDVIEDASSFNNKDLLDETPLLQNKTHVKNKPIFKTRAIRN